MKTMSLIRFGAAGLAAATLAFASMAMSPSHVAEAEPPKVDEKAPDFTLTDTDGKEHKLSEYTKDGKIVVLEWFNPGCPFVKKHYTGGNMNKVAAEFKDKDVVWLLINSGAPGKQGAGKETNVKRKKDWKIERPILLDESGEVGKLYGAKKTPEMYVIDTEGVLRYHGAIDNNRRANRIGDVNYVRSALDKIIAGETVTTKEEPAYGCSVKYASPGR